MVNVKKIMSYVVRWLLPLALTILLVSYMFKKVNFSDMWEIVTHGVDSVSYTHLTLPTN